MKRYQAALLAISLVTAMNTNGAAEDDSTPAKNAPAPSVAPAQFSPGFADMMTMLIQPRHIRLYLAGTAKNWELAAFQMRELRAGFRRAAQTVPQYQNNDVDKAVAAIIGPQMQAVDAAIAAADAAQFTKAYASLTAACNACHVYLEHPFLRIKVPSVGANEIYPNEEFRSVP